MMSLTIGKEEFLNSSTEFYKAEAEKLMRCGILFQINQQTTKRGD
jgi:hypothetical protein